MVVLLILVTILGCVAVELILQWREKRRTADGSEDLRIPAGIVPIRAAQAATVSQADPKGLEFYGMLIDTTKCMGCRYCMVSCPFDAPKYGYNSNMPYRRKAGPRLPRKLSGSPKDCFSTRDTAGSAPKRTPSASSGWMTSRRN